MRVDKYEYSRKKWIHFWIYNALPYLWITSYQNTMFVTKVEDQICYWHVWCQQHRSNAITKKLTPPASDWSSISLTFAMILWKFYFYIWSKIPFIVITIALWISGKWFSKTPSTSMYSTSYGFICMYWLVVHNRIFIVLGSENILVK